MQDGAGPAKPGVGIGAGIGAGGTDAGSGAPAGPEGRVADPDGDYAPLHRSFLSVVAVLVGAGILNLGHGLLTTYLPLRLAEAGFASRDAGLMAAGFSGGFILGCLAAPRMIARVGHIRVFAAAAALAAAATLAFSIALEPALWIGLRGLHGLATAALFTVTESWLNDRTPSHNRGRVMAIYMLIAKMAMIFGQLTLLAGDTHGLVYLMLGSAAYSLCLIPMAVTRAPQPRVPRLRTMGLRAFYRLAPAAAIGVFCIGLLNAAVINLGPVYAVRSGLAPGETAAALAALQAGSLLVQWPIGWLSDRFDRRVVIVVAGLLIALISLAVALVGPTEPGLMIAMFAAYGAIALSVFAVLIAHANDRVASEDRVALASTLLLTWAAGSVVGPPVASLLMDGFGVDALFFYAAGVAAAMGGFVLWRIARRPAPPLDRRPPFVNLAATSPQLSRLDPRVRPAAGETGGDESGREEAGREAAGEAGRAGRPGNAGGDGPAR